METLTGLYRPSLALLTDLYQLTMACGYWKSGRAELQASFNLIFRKAPFGGSHAIACGIAAAADWLRHLRFDGEDLDYLASLRAGDGSALFPSDFLDYLASLEFSCDVHAVPEGTVVFAHEPLVRVEGPILQCQIAETALLTLINFETLIATKASRVCRAARGKPVLEFGLRRAQGADGGLSAARAAYVGGCAATSNVLAGRLFDIPVRGTHAHSWVMSFDTEQEAFAAYAEAMPNNCTFLVDTYDTLQGVRHAVEAGRELRRRGYEMTGIRLDSGDLTYLSREARRILDEEGFPAARIVASSDLDDEIIESLLTEGAAIDIFGVGTRLVTAYDQPALGGVYKLGAIREPEGAWVPRIKTSEQMAKSSVPGRLQVRRYTGEDGLYTGDAIHDVDEPPGDDGCLIIDPVDPVRRKEIPAGTPGHDLLVPLFEGGRYVGSEESLEVVRERARRELERLHPAIVRLKNPHRYPAGLLEPLHERRARMILEARKGAVGREESPA